MEEKIKEYLKKELEENKKFYSDLDEKTLFEDLLAEVIRNIDFTDSQITVNELKQIIVNSIRCNTKISDADVEAIANRWKGRYLLSYITEKDGDRFMTIYKIIDVYYKIPNNSIFIKHWRCEIDTINYNNFSDSNITFLPYENDDAKEFFIDPETCNHLKEEYKLFSGEINPFKLVNESVDSLLKKLNKMA